MLFDIFKHLFVSAGILFFCVNSIGAFVTPDNPLALNPSASDFSVFTKITVS